MAGAFFSLCGWDHYLLCVQVGGRWQTHQQGSFGSSRMQQYQEMPPMVEVLRSVVNSGTEAEIKSALAHLKAKQKQPKTESEGGEALLKLLTLC